MLSQPGPPLLFLDLDGTVRHGYDELGRFVNTAEDVVVFPEAITLIKAWIAKGGRAYGVSNQGGVALGYLSFDDCFSAVEETVKQCDMHLTDVYICPHDPEGDCFCRKPLPGMIFSAIIDSSEEFGLSHRSECLMVGDRPEDEKAAQAAGVPFQWAAEWRAQASVV